MPRPTVQWNHGMLAATLLLLVGAVLVLLGGEGPLHTVGFGIVILALALYLGARIWMVVRGDRRP